MAEIKTCHERYCSEQLKNLKTSRVLAAAFSDNFAQEYMSKVMFDYRQSSDVGSAKQETQTVASSL